MKIDEIKINSYGKLKDKNINFKDGINIVYGDNEKGKSTLLNFIVNMFYGTSRNKKGREISDYEKFKPWDTEEFSGKIMYTLDNKNRYEVFREFGKKNPKVYNEDMEDITKQYSIDKNTGSQFFLEQTRVDEQTFTSTVVSYQNEVELDNQTQNVLLQKMANTSSTGDDNISYKKAMDRLNKKQLDEIGTSRSQGKPINIVTNEINNLNTINENLKRYENYKYEIEDKKYEIEKELQNLEYKRDCLKEINSINNEEEVESEKLRYNENKIDELEEKIQELLEKKENILLQSKDAKLDSKENFNKLPYIIAILMAIILLIGLFIFSKPILAIIPAIFIIATIIIFFSKNNKNKKINFEKESQYKEIVKNNKELEKKAYEINAQIEILEKNQQEQINEAENIKNKIIKNINIKKENVKIKYNKNANISEINNYINSKNLNYEIDQIQRIITDKNMELHRLKLDKENILPKLEELAENEEKLVINNEIYENLKKKNDAINLAKEIIEHAYQKMKSDVTPRFTEKLSENLAIVTDNKYEKVIINEEDGILIELPTGEYKNANRLSKGTIQQLYLSFRLSMIEDITEENMPIILDETFAYYDNTRLKETLKNIEEQYSKNHQIIVLTCTNREEDVLNEIGVGFNKIIL